ncbi:serine protease [Halobacteriovorax sp. ZH2_bin.1]|uniref:S1 family peptidase n=1 Tax=Halobacteriovorax sp. ZH2_bin.1 TaxID=3157724 RepID=UPI00371508AC
MKEGVIKAVATSFAISKNGHFVTVSHILDDSHKPNGETVDGFRTAKSKNEDMKKWRVSLVSWNGKRIEADPSKFICDKSKNRLDICIFKVNKLVKNYIPLSEDFNIPAIHVNPFDDKNSHYRFFTYGNPPEGAFVPLEYRLVRNHIDPKGNIWTRSYGTKYNKMIRLLDLIEQPKRSSVIGFSGAPLVDSRGKLVGMLSERWTRDVKDKYVGLHSASMAISVEYIKSFYLGNVDGLQ